LVVGEVVRGALEGVAVVNNESVDQLDSECTSVICGVQNRECCL